MKWNTTCMMPWFDLVTVVYYTIILINSWLVILSQIKWQVISHRIMFLVHCILEDFLALSSPVSCRHSVDTRRLSFPVEAKLFLWWALNPLPTASSQLTQNISSSSYRSHLNIFLQFPPNFFFSGGGFFRASVPTVPGPAAAIFKTRCKHGKRSCHCHGSYIIYVLVVAVTEGHHALLIELPYSA